MREVASPVDVQAVVDLDLQDVQARLVYRQVGHLYVEAVEVNSLDALCHVVCEGLLANNVETFNVGDCRVLVEFSKQAVEVNSAHGVMTEFVPVRGRREGTEFSLIVLNDLRKVPREGENIAML